MSTETLQALTLPVPPMLEAALGYPGTARYVAFYWIPAGDELLWDEGWRSADGAWQGWLTFTRHPRVPRVSNGTGRLAARWRRLGRPVALGVWARGRRRPAGSATG